MKGKEIPREMEINVSSPVAVAEKKTEINYLNTGVGAEGERD